VTTDVIEQEARSLLRKQRRVDSWFISRYGMNLYRGCAHACAYCDGRAERYRVEGEFGREVAVKTNAAALLTRELDPARRRKPLKRAYVFLGGGVCDAYQPLEERYLLARQALEVIARHPFPVHVLTKSTLVERDFDLLRAVHGRQRAIVSMSFSTVDDELARRFEPGCASPSERLATLARAKGAGLGAGMYLLPVLPGLSDGATHIDQALRAARAHELDFVVFGGLTLKGGRQQAHYLSVLEAHQPELRARVDALYPGQRWGQARPGYYERIERRFEQAAGRHQLAVRVPPALWSDLLDDNDRAVVVLEHMAYLSRLGGRSSSYQRAADAVAELERPLPELRDELRRLPGVGPVTERLLREVLESGSAEDYERLLRRR